MHHARFALLLPALLLSCSRAGDDSATTAGTETGPARPEVDGRPAYCGGVDPSALMGCVDKDSYVADLSFIADVRPVGSTHWTEVRELCADRLEALGYDVEVFNYGEELGEGWSMVGIDVIGVKEGSDPDAPRVLVTAHYDHLEHCEGADDNASGVAGVLEVARVLAPVPNRNTLVIACWDQEEIGLLGSSAYSVRARETGEKIGTVLNLEMIGYADSTPGSQRVPGGFDLLFPEQVAELEANDYRGDFLFAVSDDGAAAAVELLKGAGAEIGLPIIGAVLSDELKNNPLLSDLQRSDHASFWKFDYPAVFMTDTSNFRYEAYHCYNGTHDTIEKLDLDFATQVVRVTVSAAASLILGE